jgi:hypothetical protein
MADQARPLGGLDEGRMQVFRQLAGGEFGEGPGELGFVRHGGWAAPVAELA